MSNKNISNNTAAKSNKLSNRNNHTATHYTKSLAGATNLKPSTTINPSVPISTSNQAPKK